MNNWYKENLNEDDLKSEAGARFQNDMVQKAYDVLKRKQGDINDAIEKMDAMPYEVEPKEALQEISYYLDKLGVK
jgi:hypothetical protein